ncbi:MAG: hypothetical protein IJU31_00565 [Synergistaceae bacterium]|nr:hypothetical protein [Synergistaceae bacterium]
MWTVRLRSDVKRKLRQIPNPDKERIKQAIVDLNDMPELLDIKKLSGRDGYRVMVGKWRLLMDIYEEECLIDVHTLAPRGDVYKK